MEEFGLKRRDVRSFEIWLPICLQMELGVYPEPKQDDESTWETEHREYIVEDHELEEWLRTGRKQAEIYFTSVLNTQAMERMGMSYGEVSRIHNESEEIVEFPNDHNLYEADEDLMFLYERLGVLHRFMYEAKVEMDHGEENGSVPGNDQPDVEAQFGSDGPPPF